MNKTTRNNLLSCTKLSNILGEFKDVEELDNQAMELKFNGQYLASLKCMERSLLLKQHYFGYQSLEVYESVLATGEFCNLIAMKCLQEDDMEMCRNLLVKAEALSQEHDALKISTYNNMACYYRKLDRLRVALDYLEKAIAVESKMEKAPTAPDTHLNACAILSQLGKHEDALEHAQSALIMLQEELFESKLLSNKFSTLLKDEKDEKKNHHLQKESKLSNIIQNDDIIQKGRYIVLCVAHYNIGVEQEYLKRYPLSLIAYKKGVELAMSFLGEDHSVCISLTKALHIAQEALKEKKSPKKFDRHETSPIKKSLRDHQLKASYLIHQQKSLSSSSGSSSSSNKQLIRSICSKKKSPSKKEEKRFEEILQAYGNIPDVPLVIHKNKKVFSTHIDQLDTSQMDQEVFQEEFQMPSIEAKKDSITSQSQTFNYSDEEQKEDIKLLEHQNEKKEGKCEFKEEE